MSRLLPLPSGISLEDAARRVRYDFLRRAARQVGADVVAVGHTRDDQAETVLLKLARGAGLTGLGGIYPRRDEVIRPLIDVSRAELRAYLREQGRVLGRGRDERGPDQSPEPGAPPGAAGTGGGLRGLPASAASPGRRTGAGGRRVAGSAGERPIFRTVCRRRSDLRSMPSR